MHTEVYIFFRLVNNKIQVIFTNPENYTLSKMRN